MSLFGRLRDPPAPPGQVVEPTLVVENDRGRVALFARAERSLPPGEVLVQVKDLGGERRAFRTVPLDPRARLVAEEPALVLRGGLTSLVRYYRVPSDGLAAREEHYEHGALSHSYDVTLRVVGRGRVPDKAVVA